MYRVTEVEQLPEIRRGRRTGPHVDTLRRFMESRSEFAKVDDIKDKRERYKVYNGLKMAGRRPEFRGTVLVRRYGEAIYLIKQG